LKENALKKVTNDVDVVSGMVGLADEAECVKLLLARCNRTESPRPWLVQDRYKPHGGIHRSAAAQTADCKYLLSEDLQGS
jgi:hypothetical protein